MNYNLISKYGRLPFIFFIIIVTLSSCSLSENRTGYHIDKEIREDIWRLSSEFCTSIIKHDYKNARSILGDSLLAKFDTLELNRNLFGLQWALMEFQYNTQNSYYQKNLLDNYWVKARFDDPEIKPFTLKYGPKSKETAITTAILEKGSSKSCLTTIFGRYSGQWKIDHVFNGWLTLENKDVFEWLEEAKKWIDNEDYVMATYCIQVCYWLLEPVPTIWRYKNRSDVLDISQDLNRKINRELRNMYIDEISTKPKILDFYPIMNLDSIYPGVTYYTKVSLSDTVAIQNECSQLDRFFTQYYKNLNSNSIYVRIVDNDDPWEEPENSIVLFRKLNKSNL